MFFENILLFGRYPDDGIAFADALDCTLVAVDAKLPVDLKV